MWGRRELLESLVAYKVRPASDHLPGKWMTGTQNHECLAGVLAAIEYLATVGSDNIPRHNHPADQTDLRIELERAYDAINL